MIDEKHVEQGMQLTYYKSESVMLGWNNFQEISVINVDESQCLVDDYSVLYILSVLNSESRHSTVAIALVDRINQALLHIVENQLIVSFWCSNWNMRKKHIAFDWRGQIQIFWWDSLKFRFDFMIQKRNESVPFDLRSVIIRYPMKVHIWFTVWSFGEEMRALYGDTISQDISRIL